LENKRGLLSFGLGRGWALVRIFSLGEDEKVSLEMDGGDSYAPM